MDRAIKNVEEVTWRQFKLEAVKIGLPMGAFLGRLVESYREKKSAANWDAVFSHEKRLSRDEVKSLRKEISQFREGFDFR